MLKFLLLILATSLLTQAAPVPATTNCSEFSHQPVDIVSHIGENGEISLDKSSRAKFPAKELFPCGLPREFTMCISYSSSGKNRKDRCLFYLDNPATDGGAALAVCFEPDNNKLRLEYQDGSETPSQTLRFDAPEEIHNLDETHKIVVTVSLNSVTVTINCSIPQTLPLTRSSTTPFINEGSFHMGGITSPIFVGIIDHLEISPSNEHQSCCGEVKPVGAKPRCDNHTEGLLWHNDASGIFYKCVGSEWTKTREMLQAANKCSKKLNYLELAQNLDFDPPIKSTHVIQFVIDGVGSFLAITTYNDTNSLIMISINGRWEFFQNIATYDAQAVEFALASPNTPLIIVANKAGTTSPVYRWNHDSSQFVLHQKIPTYQARDVESFEISGALYLAVANHAKPDGPGLDYSIDSVIYKWDGREFVEYQQIPTTGAIDFENFKVNRYNLLAVANVLDGITTRVDSTIYYFDSLTKQFKHLQSISTIGAADWEHFEINGDHYLAVANTVAYTKPTSAPTQYTRLLNPVANNAAVKSTIYKLDMRQVQFKPYQEIETFKASDWEAFTVGCSHYLIVSNSDTNQNDEITSVVYQYKGLEQFVPVHTIKLHGAASWELFSDGEEQYLTCASNLSGETKVIKVV